MSQSKLIPILLAGMALAGGAYIARSASASHADDSLSGNAHEAYAEQAADLRVRVADVPHVVQISELPATQAEAARMLTVAEDGTETLFASQDSVSTLTMKRQADGTFATFHADANTHIEPNTEIKENTRE